MHLKNVFVLAGGTASAQLILFLASPILTRIYSPNEFGLFAVFWSIVSVLTVISSLKYELAIPLATEKERNDIGVASILVLTMFSFTLLIVITALPSSISSYLNLSNDSEILFLIPLCVLACGLYQITTVYSATFKLFSQVSISKLIQSIVLIALQVLLFKLSTLALIIGQLVAALTAAIYLNSYIPVVFSKKSLSKMCFLITKYKKFAIFSTWSGLFNALGMHMPALLFGWLFGAVYAGLYSLAVRMLLTPVGLISTSVTKVLMSDAKGDLASGVLPRKILSIIVFLSYGIGLTMFLVSYFGSDIFEFVFGEEWKDAGKFARWLTPWIVMVFAVSPLGILLELFDKQKDFLFFQISMFFLRAIAIFIGYYMNSVEVALIAFSITSFICWSFLLYYLVKIFSISNGFMQYMPIYFSLFCTLLSFSPPLPEEIKFQVMLIFIFLIVGGYGFLFKKFRSLGWSLGN
ncbi:oligosaccharide flippase family protein [Rheinheimera sp. WS51]|uniref:oligosaccharide flippase family protein n=1 Tax=Rheinheimera sp. WS51 TaxID=3425886 RepID=UPI003D8A5B16